MITCTVCNLEKPRTEFYLRKSGTLVVKKCKRCHRLERVDYYYENRTDRKKYARDYRQNNKHKIAKYVYERRWKYKRGLDPDRIKSSSNHCYLCLLPLSGDTQIDHITPLTKGGQDAYNNVAPVHGPCNNKKHAKLPHELEEPYRSRVYGKIAELRGLPKSSAAEDLS